MASCIQEAGGWLGPALETGWEARSEAAASLCRKEPAEFVQASG